jgi:iron complex outermembrane receptor protein
LHPEKSVNFSAGIVWRPIERMSITLDAFDIRIDNRIVGTGAILGQVYGQPTPNAAAVNAAISAYSSGYNLIDPQVLATGTTGVSIFANGIGTRTDGADLVVNYASDFSFGRIDWTVAATYNTTSIRRRARTPAALAGTVLYDQEAYSELTSANPKFVLDLGALFHRGPWTVDLVEKIYGPAHDYESDDGDNADGVLMYFRTQVKTTPITNLDISYQVNSQATLSVGAINLFNVYPQKTNSTILAHENAFLDPLATVQYPVWSPFGINGGYYYAKLQYKF